MGRRIRVVFLTFYFEAWDALDELYRKMLASPKFEPIVVSIPRKLTGDDVFGDESKVSDYLTSQGVEHLRFDYADPYDGFERLRDINPDYIFLNYPWQKNYQPAYRIEKLISIARVCYVPYFSLPLVNEPGIQGVAPHLFRQSTHRLAHLIFLQDRDAKAAFEGTERGGSHVHFTGTPKVDALIAKAKSETPFWPIDHKRADSSEGRAFRVLWGPHHTFSPSWLNFGVFNEICAQMLELAKRRPEIDFVLRPHPYMFGTLTSQGHMTEEQLSNWKAAWSALPNTAIDASSSYASLMLATDLMFTDGISFLVEYPLVTGRSPVFYEKPNHWAFNPLGEKAAAASIRVESFAEFESTLNKAIEWGLPSRSIEIERLFSSAVPFAGQSADRILSIVQADARDLL